MLLTTLAVEDLTTAETVVRYYTYRWRVERYHYVLKSGCHVEDLQWRLLWLTYLTRQQPDQLCTTVLRPAEWAALYADHTRRPDPAPAPVDLRTAVRWIAPRGGFLGRRSDGEPG